MDFIDSKVDLSSLYANLNVDFIDSKVDLALVDFIDSKVDLSSLYANLNVLSWILLIQKLICRLYILTLMFSRGIDSKVDLSSLYI